MSKNKWLLLGDSDSEEVLEALKRYLEGYLDGKVEVEVEVVELNSSEDIDFTSYSKVLVYLNSREIEDFSEPNKETYRKLLEAIFEKEDLPPFIFLSTERKLTYKGWKDFKGYEWCYLLYEAVDSQYIHLPKQLAELRSLVKEERDLIEGKEGKRENPLRVFGGCAWEKFKKYDKKYKERKCEGEDRYKNVTDFYLEASKFHLGEEDYRRRLSHDLVDAKGKFNVLKAAAQTKLFTLFDLIWALSQKRRFPLLKGKVSILVVDNNLRKDVKKSLEEIEKYFHWEFWQVGQDESEDFFGDLLKKIEEKKEIEVERIKYKQATETGTIINIKKRTIEDFNLILQDLYLNSDTKGDDFLPLYLEHYPRIPVFIYSGSEDSEVINRTLKKGADYYLFKTRTLALPKALLNYYERLGKLITLFEVGEYQNNLIGNIRYWNFKKDFLWFGDKCYHMVNHSFNHTRNDWEIANKLLYPILKEKGLKINKDGPNDSMTAEDLYCLSMAIWLHDIGHKGNERYSEPHQIRDNHGLIAGEFILKYPEMFKIVPEDKDADYYYKNVDFPSKRTKKPAPQLIREKNDGKGLTSLEKIALISMYHKSNCPLDEEDYKRLKANKHIPVDYFENSDYKRGRVITLKSILKKREPEGEKNFLRLVALFRFIDGIDTNKNRVGDSGEGRLKKKVTGQDTKYQLERRMKREVISLVKQDGSRAAILPFLKDFYLTVKKDINNKKPPGISDLKELSEDIGVDFDDYFTILEYASFLSVQDQHFDLHNSIDSVEIISPETKSEKKSEKIEIHYLSNQDRKFLIKTSKIREAHEEKCKTIAQHLIYNDSQGSPGENDKENEIIPKDYGNVLKELSKGEGSKGEKYLDHWFTLKKVGLWGKVGSELKLISGCRKEEDGWKKWDDKRTWNEYKMNY